MLGGITTDGETWFIVVTDKRILFINTGKFSGLQQISIDFDNVNAVSGSEKLMFGEIRIQDGDTERIIKWVPKKMIKPFTYAAQDAMEKRKKANAQSISPTPSNDRYAQLEKLAELKEKGIISEEEFIQEKKKILAKDT